MNPDFEKLPIGGRVAGNLTPEEERILYRAALEHQEIFDELADDEDLRHMMQMPRARRELLQVLEAVDRPVADRLFGWIRRPVGLALAGSMAAAAFMIALFWDKLFRSASVVPSATEMADKTPTNDAANLGPRIFALAISSTTKDVAPVLELNQESYRVGDPFRIRFTAPSGFHAMVVERRPDGSFAQIFPNALQSESSISDSGETFVPASGQGSAAVTGPPGVRRVRLFVFPAGQDPFSPASVDRGTVVEKQYTVEP